MEPQNRQLECGGSTELIINNPVYRSAFPLEGFSIWESNFVVASK